MSVRITAVQWSNTVPYEIEDALDGAELVQLCQWIDNFNQRFDSSVLVPRDGQANFIKYFRQSGHSPVGNQRAGQQRVSYGNEGRERTFKHETCHAIGMHHEFAHEDFPWNDIQDQTFVFCVPNPIAMDNLITWHRLLALNEIEVAAGGIVRQMQARNAQGAAITYSPEIDWDSIMMYGSANIGNTTWSEEDATEIVERAAPNELLTATDIAAVEALLGRPS